MDENAIVGLVIFSVFYILGDIYWVYSQYKRWVVNKSLEKDIFVRWRGTNKSHIWWILWSVFVCTDIIPFLAISFCFKDQVHIGYAAIMTLLAYLLGGMLIYSVIKLIVQAVSK